MRFLIVAFSALSVACASAVPEENAPAAPAPTRAADAGLRAYEGTYALQAPNAVLGLRVWIDSAGIMTGELASLGQRTTFRPSPEPHKSPASSRAFLQIGGGLLVGSGLAALMGLGSTRQVMLLLAADGIMLVVGLIACAVPLRRALSIQPSEALRAEG